MTLSLPADNGLLEEAITGSGVAMVALDPLMSAISDTLDTHVNRQVRQALDPLARMADRTGAVHRRHRPLQQVSTAPTPRR